MKCSCLLSQVQHNPRTRSLHTRCCCNASEPEAVLNTWLKWKGGKEQLWKYCCVSSATVTIHNQISVPHGHCWPGAEGQSRLLHWLHAHHTTASYPPGPRIESSSFLLHPKQSCLPPTNRTERSPADGSHWWGRQDSSKALSYNGDGGHKYQDKLNSSP